MSGLGEVLREGAGLWLALGGFLIGFLFGSLLARTNFCAMGGISDLMILGDGRRLRAWLLAAATAILLTQASALAGMASPAHSAYVGGELIWFGNVAGGLLFGIGMVLAGGCVSRNLARAGAGDLRALVVLVVLGLTVEASVTGPLAQSRESIAGFLSVNLGPQGQTLSALLAARTGLPAAIAVAVATSIASGVLFIYCLGPSEFRQSRQHLWSGIGVGALVFAGWLLTGLCRDEFDLVPTSSTSLTFVRPLGDATRWVFYGDKATLPSFGVASVAGTFLGASFAAFFQRRLRFQFFVDAGDIVRAVLGAIMMGFGGVVGLGCTIGQGVTGASTLALGSFLSIVSLVSGGFLGVSLLQLWFARSD